MKIRLADCPSHLDTDVVCKRGEWQQGALMDRAELEAIRSCSVTFYARGGQEATLMEPENAAVQFNQTGHSFMAQHFEE